MLPVVVSRIFVRAASGRQRFNVLGAWNAVTRELVAVTNTTVVNTETMCELLRKIAALGLSGPITMVLDNARYQRNVVVQSLAESLGIELLFLPSYSPNLNLSNAFGNSSNDARSTAATIPRSPTSAPPSKRPSTAYPPSMPPIWPP